MSKQIDSNRFEELNHSYQDIVSEVTREFNESRGSKRSRIDFEEDLSYMSSTQQQSFKDEQKQIDEEISKRVLEKVHVKKRDVVPCRKLRVIDANKPDRNAILTLWQPQQVFNYWNEGTCLRITHTHPQNVHDGLRLSTSTASLIQAIEKHSFTVPKELTRSFTRIKVIGTTQPKFNEVDTHGLVLDISALPAAELAMIGDTDGNIIAINFWGTLREHGLAGIVQPGTFLRFENLECRDQGSQVGMNGSQFITLFFGLNTKLSDMKNRTSSAETEFIESFKTVDIANLFRMYSEKIRKEISQTILQDGAALITAPNKRRSSGETIVSLSIVSNKTSTSSTTEPPPPPPRTRRRLGTSLGNTTKRRRQI